MINWQIKPVKMHRLMFFGYCVCLGYLANLAAIALPITVPLTVGNVAVFVILARLGLVWGLASFLLVTLPLTQSPAVLLSAAQSVIFLLYFQSYSRNIWRFAVGYVPVCAAVCYVMLPAGISQYPLMLGIFVLLSTAVFAWCTKAASVLIAMSASASQLRKQSLKNQLSHRFGLYAAIPATFLITLSLDGATSVTLVKNMAAYHFQLGELKSDVELKLSAYLSIVSAMADLPGTSLDKAALQHLVSQHPEFISALTTDNQGDVTQFYKADVTNNELIGASVADRTYFQAVKAYKQPYVSDTFTGRVLGKDQLFALSAPLGDAEIFRGILQVSVNLDALLDVFPSDNTEMSHQILLDNAGKKIWGNKISGAVGELWVRPPEAIPMPKSYLQNSIFNPLNPIIISKDAQHFMLQDQIGSTGWKLNYFIDTQPTILVLYLYFAVALGLITLILEASVHLSKRFVSRYTMALEQLVYFTTHWDGKTANQSKPDFVQSALEIDTLTDSFVNMQRRVSGAHHAIVATMHEVRQLNSELEQRVEQRTHELEQERDKANHLAAVKTRFLANMSHELRTPITIIKGFTETLLSRNESHNMPFLLRIQQNTEHLHNVVNDILDVAKMDAGKMSFAPELVHARALLDDIGSSLIQLGEQKALKVELDFALSDQLCIWADPFRLKQILLNLISNAVKFTPQGTVCFAAAIDNNNLLIRVIDQGVGIAADKIPTLFQAFNQADSSISRDYGGTGLGLYISRELSEAMDMSLSVDSVLHQGSTFTLFIPAKLLSIEEPNLPAEAEVTPNSNFTNIKHESQVLIVDDVKDIRDLIASFLKDTGASLHFAIDGSDALDKVQRQKFDLILMDQQMPRMDGRTAAERIRQQGILTPIIQLSADVFSEQTDLGPFNDSLAKPIDKSELLEAISHQLKENLTIPAVVGAEPDNDDDLVQDYLASLAAQAETLLKLASAKQTEALQRELHKIKGTSACFGLTAVSEAAHEAEIQLKTSALSEAILEPLVSLMQAHKVPD